MGLNISNITKKHYIIIVAIAVLLVAIFLISSCDKISNFSNQNNFSILNSQNTVIESNISDSIYIPPAANEKAMKEIEEEEHATERQFDDLPVPAKNSFTISDKNFLTEIYNVKKYIQLYKDKTITVEGMFAIWTSADETIKSPIVYRNGPNEYINDSFAGFLLNDLKNQTFEIDDWVKVVGKPFLYEEKYLFLNVESIEKLPDNKRGAEFSAN
jgi:putative membrane protein